MAKKRVHRPEGSRPVPPPQAKRAKGRTTPSGGSGASLRERFEDASRPVLLRMQALPGFLIPVTLGVLLFFGLTLSANWSGILLIVIALFLFWLTAVSWPRITTGSRILRVVVDVAVLVLGVLKLMGRL
jgi:Family of unknown function (DUF6703)